MRIRTIKPEFFLHEGLFELERATGLPIRLAFAGLWCAADREGRFKWEPRKLKTQILPYDEIDFSKLLDALAESGMLLRYGDALQFGVIPSFTSHQRVNIREAKSELPEPTVNACASTCVHVAGKVHTPNGQNIPEPLRQTVIARDGGKCLRCQAKDDLTIDHIFPRSVGGSHAITNLRTLCRPCNSRRPVQGQGLIDDLAKDGFTFADMQSTCLHVQDNELHVPARVEGKGREGNKEGNGIPPNPQGGEKEKAGSEAGWSPTAEQRIINSWFGRRDSTPWGDKELRAWKALGAATITEGIAALQNYYSQPNATYRRKDVQTLLNNWRGEMDRWRNHKPAVGSDTQLFDAIDPEELKE